MLISSKNYSFYVNNEKTKSHVTQPNVLYFLIKKYTSQLKIVVEKHAERIEMLYSVPFFLSNHFMFITMLRVVE